jgi:hypothetical protein
MNYPGAIVVAAALIAGALLATGRVESQSPPIGMYRVASNEPRSVWLVNTASGAIWYCQYTTITAPLTCNPPKLP